MDRALTQTAEAARLGPTTGDRCRFLVRVFPEGVQPSVFSLGEPRVILGRSPGPQGITIDDARMSRQHAALALVDGGVRIEDLGSKNGVFVEGDRVQTEYLYPGATLRLGDSLFVFTEATLLPGMGELVPSPERALLRACAEAVADRAALTPTPVLIRGPTGSGKERMAERIHAASGRSGPLVTVNCATFQRELLASELFGHVKGAFSGAGASRKGLFAQANGGTIFLDEIAELPLDQQPALLRVLQEGRIRPVGADYETPVDVRVVSATHQDLSSLVEQGAFRDDLLARLALLEIKLPGLSERKEEILALFSSLLGPGAPPLILETAERLLRHSWPRNVRELQRAASHVRLFVAEAAHVGPALLPTEVGAGSEATALPNDDPDRESLIALLERHRGSVSEVAKSLGKHRAQVYRWLRRYRIEAKSYRA